MENDTSRVQQMHEDMLSTLDVASLMVQASYEKASAALEQRDQEIQRLLERIDELELLVSKVRAAAERESVVV